MSITCSGTLCSSFLIFSYDHSWGGYAPYGKQAIKNKLLQYLNSINFSWHVLLQTAYLYIILLRFHETELCNIVEIDLSRIRKLIDVSKPRSFATRAFPLHRVIADPIWQQQPISTRTVKNRPATMWAVDSLQSELKTEEKPRQQDPYTRSTLALAASPQASLPTRPEVEDPPLRWRLTEFP